MSDADLRFRPDCSPNDQGFPRVARRSVHRRGPAGGYLGHRLVLAATELHDAITAAGESGNGALAPEDDQTYVLSCARIADAVQALRDAAAAVTQLSAELAAADAVAQLDAERAERAEQSAGRIERLVTAQAATPTTPATTVTDLSETITTRTVAYRELRQA